MTNIAEGPCPLTANSCRQLSAGWDGKICNIFYTDVRLREQVVEKGATEAGTSGTSSQNCVETVQDSSCADHIRNYLDDKGKRNEAILCIFLLFRVQSEHIFSTAISIPPPKKSQQSIELTFSKMMLESFPDYIFSSLIYTSEDNANQGGTETGETSSDPGWFIISGCIIRTWRTMLVSQASRKKILFAGRLANKSWQCTCTADMHNCIAQYDSSAKHLAC